MNILDDSEVIQRVQTILVDAVGDPSLATAFGTKFQHQGGAPIVTSLNQFWKRELATVDADTTSERACLVDDATPAAWLRHFTEHVVPTVRRFRLPHGNL